MRRSDGDLADLFGAAYDVTGTGNWEGRTILRRTASDADLGARFGLTAERVASRLAEGRAILAERRDRRPQPARDDKVLAGWNGLAIAAFADAAAALDATGAAADAAQATELRRVAIAAAELILGRLRRPDGLLGRSWKDGRASADGILEDHACLAEGLLALYAATFDERWFVAARGLADTILIGFGDPAGGFFDTSDVHETLITRPKDLQDNAVPSGNAMATTVLLRLADADRAWCLSLGGGARARAGRWHRRPSTRAAFAQWLVALDSALADVIEVAVVGDPADAATRRLLGPLRSGFHPHVAVACAPDPEASVVELLGSRFKLDGRPTAFVCRDFACRQPVVEPEALAAQLIE